MSKILIVEDEATLAETLAENLAEEGHEVLTAADGENGLTMIRTHLPDLIVLDIMLPVLDGLSVCRIIRKDAATSHIPIIMLTARGTAVVALIEPHLSIDTNRPLEPCVAQALAYLEGDAR